MGSLHATEFAGAVKRDEIKLDVALTWHLQSNHFPPINLAFLPTAKQAIELANDGEWREVIKMPNGKALTVAQIIEGLHLESFLNSEGD